MRLVPLRSDTAGIGFTYRRVCDESHFVEFSERFNLTDWKRRMDRVELRDIGDDLSTQRNNGCFDAGICLGNRVGPNVDLNQLAFAVVDKAQIKLKRWHAGCRIALG